jgi:hypothetical protein
MTGRCGEGEPTFAEKRRYAGLLSPAKKEGFVSLFAHELDYRSADVFLDRFNPVVLRLEEIQRDMEGKSLYTMSDWVTDRSRSTFNTVIKYAAREAAIEIPAYTYGLDILDDYSDKMSHLVKNTISSVDEEELQPRSISYHTNQRNWWKRISEAPSVTYGLRPFRKNPYAYLGYAIRDEEDIIVQTHLRYRFEDFSEHKLEVAINVPITETWNLDIGTEFESRRDSAPLETTVRLRKEWSSWGGISFGFSIREKPSVLVAIAGNW